MEKSMEELFKEVLENGMGELSLDDMDKVSGGTMTSSDRATLKSFLKMAKEMNLSLDQVLSYVPQYFPLYTSKYPNVTMDEVIKYIRAVYPKL